jgi:formate hydrogenlyase transcriptional activator
MEKKMNQRAEDMLRESEVRLELFFSQSLDGFFFMMLDEPVRWDDTVDKDQVLDYVFSHQRMTKVNDAMLAQYGATREQFLGLTPNDFYQHNLASGREGWRRFFDAGRLHVETDERKLDGTPMSIEGDYLCFYDAEGRITGHFGIQREVTERKRAEAALRQYNQRLKTLQEIDRAILAARSPAQIAQAAMRHIHELVPCLRASVAVFDFEASKAVLIAIHAKAETKLVAGTELTLEAFGDIGQLWLGKVNVVEDTEKFSLPSEVVASVRTEGVRAYINVPLRAQGELIGVLNLGSEHPGSFSDEQIEITQEVADSLAIAIRQARLFEQIEHHTVELEKRVAARTAELSTANASLKNEIAERERIEAVLRENEERYRSLYNNTPVMLHSIDSEKKLVSVNDFWLKSLGYERHEVIGRRVTEFLTESSRRFTIEAAFPKLFQTGSLKDAEIQFVKKSGEVIDVLVSALLKRDEQGKLLWTLAFLLDVTERKRAERALHQRLAIEQMLSEISTRFINLSWQQVDEGINYTLERIGKLAGVDRSYLFLFFDEGKKAQNTHEWCAPEVTSQRQNLQDMAVADFPWIFTKVLRGETVYVPRVAELPAEAQAEKTDMLEQAIQSLLIVPLTFGGGVTGFLGFDSVKSEKIWQAEDVRLLKVVGEIIANFLQRVRAEQAIRVSEERLRAIGNALPDIVFVINETGRYVEIMTSKENLLYLSAERLEGQTFHEVFPKPEADRFLALVQKTIATRQSQVLEYDLNVPAGQRWFEGRTAPLQLKIDGKDCIVFVARDITDRKRADELHSQNVYLQEELRRELRYGEMIGVSEAMQKVFRNLEMVAATDSSVLLLGETGTGKELIARAIHNLSQRKDRVMVKVNCGALPAGLVESELFGHEKGAFTGATVQKKGRFELANNGTIFLDEVGELALETQVKLLRVLQEQEFERVGGAATLKVNVRVIAATNRHLEEDVKNGSFRPDLFYRLNIFPIQVPALRERADDIPLLANYLISQFARRLGKRITGINQQALEKLLRYEWPGNVRELANILERAVILCQGRILQEEHIGKLSEIARPSEDFVTLEEAERQHILQALEKTNGVLAGPKGAAQLLGLNRSTLWSRMRKLGINFPTQNLASRKS